MKNIPILVVFSTLSVLSQSLASQQDLSRFEGQFTLVSGESWRCGQEVTAVADADGLTVELRSQHSAQKYEFRETREEWMSRLERPKLVIRKKTITLKISSLAHGKFPNGSSKQSWTISEAGAELAFRDTNFCPHRRDMYQVSKEICTYRRVLP